jgi:hypothetical protein
MATSSKVQGAPNLIDSARIEWKLGKYGVGQGKDLKNPSVWQRTQEYRRVQASRLVPIEKKDIRSRLPAGEYHLSRKVDGELAVLWFEGGEALLVNPGGTVRVGLPLLVDAAKKLGKASVKSALVRWRAVLSSSQWRPSACSRCRKCRACPQLPRGSGSTLFRGV